MGQLVVNGALTMCTFGVAPGAMNVLPMNLAIGVNQPAATIMDNIPMVNIPSYGMCLSLANPTTAAATAAALGVLTPTPCLPVPASPWIPGSPTVLISGKPALNSTSKCMCAYGGVISVIMPGQMTVQVP
jgi:uncharacterized Zn-binding protein involved in type VI secretion